MSQRPEPPPEGALIKTAMEKSGLSARKAAGEAGISEGRWRQIVSGYQIVSAGQYAPVRGPADTVARMAAAAGVSADALHAAGRPDAAVELRLIYEERVRAQANLAVLPADFAEIKDPTPTEAVLLQMMAATKQQMLNEINSLRKEVEELREREDMRDQRGA